MSMNEEQILEEARKLPRDAIGRLRKALDEIYLELEDPKPHDFFTKAALARYEAIKDGRLKLVPIEELTNLESYLPDSNQDESTQ